MSDEPKKTALQPHLQKALSEIGGDPLDGSGFERETPDPEFTAHAPDCAPARS